jgi:uncharacterized membrane protein
VSFLALVLILIAVITFVAGQLLLKKGMQFAGRIDVRSGRFIVPLATGIFSMTISFFLTLGLLQHFDLSYLYPFQGLSIIIISLLAAVILKEKLTLRLTTGALLITAGVVLVALS